MEKLAISNVKNTKFGLQSLRYQAAHLRKVCLMR